MNKIIYQKEIRGKIKEEITPVIKEFISDFSPVEDELVYVFSDQKTKAIYLECHIEAKKIVNQGTIDVPLDPSSQADYRANREVIQDHSAYIKMKEDALNKRTFSNMVAEYTMEFDEQNPLKIIGGQHRYLAIKDSLKSNINQRHGVKVYFKLNSNQRLDVQLISNTNIAISPDLLDRMYETIHGPELRDWCQKVSLLEKGQDFSDRKTQTSQITVRAARTFIMNFYNGMQIKDKDFDQLKTTPILAKTGGNDDNWEELKNKNKNIWSFKPLIKAGKQFAQLHNNQKKYFTSKKLPNFDFVNKALNYAVISAWAYISGVLHKNTKRLNRHYDLKNVTKEDPLNSLALSKARHKTDPDNYRGLGTRTDAKERGRLAEVFFLHAEKGREMTKQMIDVAIKKYHMKQALIEVNEAESKLK